MRKLTHYMTPGLMAAALLLAPALASKVAAQNPAATPAATPAAATPAAAPQDQACIDLYTKFYDLWKLKTQEKQAEGYPIGKEYMTKCGQNDDQYTKYVKAQLAKYEAATLRFNFEKAVATGKAEAVADVYNYGKQLLVKDPADLQVIIDLGHYGNLAYVAKNTTYKADAISYSKQALQMIEAGKTAPKLDPFKSTSDAASWLNYFLAAVFYAEKNYPETIAASYRAATSSVEGQDKGVTLFYLSEAYRLSEVDPAYDALKKFEGQDVSPESEAAKTHWYQVMDRASEFYARAINALSDPKNKSLKDASMEQLTIYYKLLHDNKDTGLTEYIAKAGTSAVPDPKSPLPARAPATPATSATSTGNVTMPIPGATTGGVKPAMGSGAATPNGKPMTPASTPAPAPKPVSAKPPTRNKSNHSKHK
ncbi:MAG: hypothetical protein ABIP75_10010 [Pyrinomonadaceae bacterium]